MRKVSRRRFLEQTSAALAVAAAAPNIDTAASGAAPALEAQSPAGLHAAARVTVNGRLHTIDVHDRWTLAELLRDRLGLTGTKIGCDRGECGACTVLLDGQPIYACSYLAAWLDGRTIQTVEGLINGDRLDPLQQAFIDHDGPQCGFCTSGQLMTAKALLSEYPNPSADQVKAALAGNLCRCSNYNRYVESVVAAAAPAGTRPAMEPGGAR